MRKFSSYGMIDEQRHYYASRTSLIEHAYQQLMGDAPDEEGHYITVWAPRQTGKSSVMKTILWRLRADDRYAVVKLGLEHLKMETSVERIVWTIANDILSAFGKPLQDIRTLTEFPNIFQQEMLDKPLILILDEFDALAEEAISGLVGTFRNIYLARQEDARPSAQKAYRLHAVALIGVRSVLGVENRRGSSFNVQRSIHIPNLTYQEVVEMFRWYERDSGRTVEQAVIDRLYAETNGQPGLTCWFGELLTEGFEDYRPDVSHPMTLDDFREVYAAASAILPNNTILNMISKAKEAPAKERIFELFRTDEKQPFTYDDPELNFLYLNGILDREKVGREDYYVKFASPFIQKRLFQYFAGEFFRYTGKLHEPFENLTDVFTPDGLNIRNLAKRYESYLQKNREWLFRDAPRRKDLRLFEAVYHFSFYRFLCDFLGTKYASVYPEFPTGNGQIDLIIKHQGTVYGIELKSFADERQYRDALTQAARYGQHLQLTEITLIVFVERIDADHRRLYEVAYRDPATGVSVTPTFVETGL